MCFAHTAVIIKSTATSKHSAHKCRGPQPYSKCMANAAAPPNAHHQCGYTAPTPQNAAAPPHPEYCTDSLCSNPLRCSNPPQRSASQCSAAADSCSGLMQHSQRRQHHEQLQLVAGYGTGAWRLRGPMTLTLAAGLQVRCGPKSSQL